MAFIHSLTLINIQLQINIQLGIHLLHGKPQSLSQMFLVNWHEVQVERLRAHLDL